MTTIYKNNNESSWSKYVLSISFSEIIDGYIHDWQVTTNKIVFDEQVKTGSFHGLCPIDDKRRLKMQGLIAKGIIQPYYGATSTNACAYTLQVTTPTCIIGVEHEMVNERVSFEDTVEIIQTDSSTIGDNQKKGFIVAQNEYRTMQKWKHWNAKDEFTSRYIYKFSSCSIGSACTVIDTFTKEQIDISDYSSW